MCVANCSGGRIPIPDNSTCGMHVHIYSYTSIVWSAASIVLGYRIAGNIDEDFNLTLWRFKHQIAKNKTVKKSRGLIKFAIHCVPFIAHHCWRVKENIGSGGVVP